MIKTGVADMIQLLHVLYSSLWRWTSTKTQWRAALIYQSHSVTLTCVDRDSYQSRLGLTTL